MELKKLISLALLSVAMSAHAANPTFNSFDTNQFNANAAVNSIHYLDVVMTNRYFVDQNATNPGIIGVQSRPFPDLNTIATNILPNSQVILAENQTYTLTASFELSNNCALTVRNGGRAVITTTASDPSLWLVRVNPGTAGTSSPSTNIVRGISFQVGSTNGQLIVVPLRFEIVDAAVTNFFGVYDNNFDIALSDCILCNINGIGAANGSCSIWDIKGNYFTAVTDSIRFPVVGNNRTTNLWADIMGNNFKFIADPIGLATNITYSATTLGTCVNIGRGVYNFCGNVASYWGVNNTTQHVNCLDMESMNGNPFRNSKTILTVGGNTFQPGAAVNFTVENQGIPPAVPFNTNVFIFNEQTIPDSLIGTTCQWYPYPYQFPMVPQVVANTNYVGLTGVQTLMTYTTPLFQTNTYRLVLTADVSAISVDVANFQISYTSGNQTAVSGAVVPYVNTSGSLATLVSTTGNYQFTSPILRLMPNTTLTLSNNFTVGGGSATYNVAAALELTR